MKQYTFDEALDIGKRVTAATSFLVGTAITLAIGIILIRFLWAWTVPDIFPAAVEQGLVAGTITWLTAFKITAIAALLTTSGSLIAGKWRR